MKATTNYHEDLPIMITLWAKHPKIRRGCEDSMHVQTRDWSGKPDCQIGNFTENFWFRPKSATKKGFKGYKTLATLKAAVVRCLKAKGFTDVRFDDKEIAVEMERAKALDAAVDAEAVFTY